MKTVPNDTKQIFAPVIELIETLRETYHEKACEIDRPRFDKKITTKEVSFGTIGKVYDLGIADGHVIACDKILKFIKYADGGLE